jgi:hypothetical protein
MGTAEAPQHCLVHRITVWRLTSGKSSEAGSTSKNGNKRVTGVVLRQLGDLAGVGVAGALSGEELQCGEALHAVAPAQLGLRVAVHGAHHGDTLHVTPRPTPPAIAKLTLSSTANTTSVAPRPFRRI